MSDQFTPLVVTPSAYRDMRHLHVNRVELLSKIMMLVKNTPTLGFSIERLELGTGNVSAGLFCTPIVARARLVESILMVHYVFLGLDMIVPVMSVEEHVPGQPYTPKTWSSSDARLLRESLTFAGLVENCA